MFGVAIDVRVDVVCAGFSRGELVIRGGGFQTHFVPCLLGCLALSFPRVILLVVWLSSDYLEWAFETKLWPVLGWLFMPTTTLAWAFAMHYGEHRWTPVGIAAVVVGVLIDLGLLGSNRRRPKRGGAPRGGPPRDGGEREIVVEGRRVG